MTDHPKPAASAGQAEAEGDARRTPRMPVGFPAEIVIAGRRFPVTVHNISEGGVMIDGSVLPEVGRVVTFSAASLSVDARAVWQRQGACGMEFLTAIDPLEAVRKNVVAPPRGKR